jgi:hypothetical protein
MTSTRMVPMHGRERRTQLRSAVAQDDGASLVALLRQEPWPADALQLIGDGLIAALTRRVDGAAELAHECVEALRERGWEGDAELAEGLDSRLGAGPAPLLRPLPIDLDELSMVLEGDPVHGGGRIDLRTGAVWPQPAIEYAREVGDEDEDDEDDPERWLWFDSEGSRAGYRDMELFIAGIEDPDTAGQLGRALVGRGAFGRFKHLLTRWPDLQDPWYAFSEDRQRGRARAWLAGEGHAATPPRPHEP